MVMLTPPQEPDQHTTSHSAGARSNALVIALAGGRHGVGKTNVAVNIAVNLANGGAKVCLLDSDNQLSGAVQLLGGKSELGLGSHIFDGQPLEAVIQTGRNGIQLLAAPSNLAAFDYTQTLRLKTAFQKLESHFDYLIIDTPPGDSLTTLSLLRSANHILLVLSPELESIKDSYTLLWALRRRGHMGGVQVLINRIKGRQQGLQVYRQFKRVVEKNLGLSVRSLGYVTADRHLHNAVYNHMPVSISAPNAPSSRCFHAITEILKQRFIGHSPLNKMSRSWKMNPPRSGASSPVVQMTPRQQGALATNEQFDRLFAQFSNIIRKEDISEASVRKALFSFEESYELRFKQPLHEKNPTPPAVAGRDGSIEKIGSRLRQSHILSDCERKQSDELADLQHALESAAQFSLYEQKRYADNSSS